MFWRLNQEYFLHGLAVEREKEESRMPSDSWPKLWWLVVPIACRED